MAKEYSLNQKNYLQVRGLNGDLVCVDLSSVYVAFAESNINMFGVPFNELQSIVAIGRQEVERQQQEAKDRAAKEARAKEKSEKKTKAEKDGPKGEA